MKENNKLLAEFMGIRPYKLEAFYGNITTATNHIEKPCFHNSWEWLMEVVEKIESLGFEFFIVESRCRIAHNTDKSIETIIDFEILGTKIEAVYNACVEFVEWWNKEEYQKAVMNSIDLE